MTTERYLYVAEVTEGGHTTGLRVFMTFDEADTWVKAALHDALVRYAEASGGALFDEKVVTSDRPGEWYYASQVYGHYGQVRRAQSEVKVWSEVKHMMGEEDEFEILGSELKDGEA